ncbi:hypothetical protein [Devosia sp. Root413D1]|nr:hypothetical protein [Devosia sp. Root413D1]
MTWREQAGRGDDTTAAWHGACYSLAQIIMATSPAVVPVTIARKTVA